MLSYIVRRVIVLIPLLVILSIICFVLIELPPGNFLTMYVLNLEQLGTKVSKAEIAWLTVEFNLDKPVYTRYSMWMWNIIRHGNFGRSLAQDKPVTKLIGERIVLTMVISICTLIFTWMMAIPIGIYSAVHQYSPSDYVFTFLGFIGLATPNFLLALVLMWSSFSYLGISVGGLFSPEYVDVAWSLAKIWNMFQHLWIPVIVIGTAGTAGLVRILRGCLLDELHKQYVITARAKGVSERKLLFKYPVRVAINPLISTVGWLLPMIVSGEAITAIVLNLPTTGPLLLQALLTQDMYLAGSLLMILSTLTVIGTLISDILLAWLDPRIRYKGISE